MADEASAMASPRVRAADREDLPGVLRLYAQPDLDDGAMLAMPDAERIFARMSSYPDYTLYVAVSEDGTVIGTFALLVMDNGYSFRVDL